jgi:hypothetical protein
MAADDPEPAKAQPSAPDAAPEATPKPGKPLPPEAERALAEAAARRAARDRAGAAQPKELQGRGGLDPTRYGDWEVNGMASDF